MMWLCPLCLGVFEGFWCAQRCFLFLVLCLSLLSGVSLWSYLPGHCHFLLDTGLLSLRLQNPLSSAKGGYFCLTQRFFPASVCFFLISIFPSVRSLSPLFSISVCPFPLSSSPSFFPLPPPPNPPSLLPSQQTPQATSHSK